MRLYATHCPRCLDEIPLVGGEDHCLRCEIRRMRANPRLAIDDDPGGDTLAVLLLDLVAYAAGEAEDGDQDAAALVRRFRRMDDGE